MFSRIVKKTKTTTEQQQQNSPSSPGENVSICQIRKNVKAARTRVVTHFGFYAILNARGEAFCSFKQLQRIFAL